MCLITRLANKYYWSGAYDMPKKIINTIKEMYQNYECKCYIMETWQPFQVNSGVQQGCILSPTLFLLVLGHVMRVMREQHRDVQWRIQDILKDIDFADKICLMAQRYWDIKEKLARLQRGGGGEAAGLKIKGSQNQRNVDKLYHYDSAGH